MPDRPVTDSDAPASPIVTSPAELLAVLRDMHGSTYCSTPLCSGPSFGFEFDSETGFWAMSHCPCGSTDQGFSLTRADLMVVLDCAADALFGRCGECGEVAHPTADIGDAGAHDAATDGAGHE